MCSRAVAIILASLFMVSCAAAGETADPDASSGADGAPSVDSAFSSADGAAPVIDAGHQADSPPGGQGNPDSVGYGARKSIAIDGANTGGEWGADTLLIRDPAADDARFLGANWTAHEAPWDYAALHAAWDDDNLYVGIQFVNVTDVLDPSNLGSSEGSQIHGMDLVQFVAFDVIGAQGYSTGGDMWGKDQEFAGGDQPEFQLYFHSNFSQEGTYLSKWNGVALEPFVDGLANTSLTGAGGEFFVGSALAGVNPTADDSAPGEYGAADIDYIADRSHDTAYDTFFELQIPLDLLDIDAARLDGGTIGVFAANGDGSAVNCIPNDPATSSTAGTSQSNSPLEWDFAVDDDEYAAPFAWIGTPQ